MIIKNVELFVNPSGRDVIINDLSNQSFSVHEPSMHDFTCSFLDMWEPIYTESFKAVFDLYNKAHQGKFLMAQRIIRCNFHINDNTPDIDDDGIFHLENVPCPLKFNNFCKHHCVICRPKIHSELTKREFEVAKLLAEGFSPLEIANTLYISVETVTGHRTNIYSKLNINRSNQLTALAYKRGWII